MMTISFFPAALAAAVAAAVAATVAAVAAVAAAVEEFVSCMRGHSKKGC